MTYGAAISLTFTEGAALAVVERLAVDSIGHHYVRDLEAFPTGTAYSTIAARIAPRIQDEALRQRPALIDITDVGGVVSEVFAAAGAGVTTQGIRLADAPDPEGDDIVRADLLGLLLLLTQDRRLHIASTLPQARQLTKDLGAVRDPKNLSVLVRAASLACWAAEEAARRDADFEGWIDYVRSLQTPAPTRSFAEAWAMRSAPTTEPCELCGAIGCRNYRHRR